MEIHDLDNAPLFILKQYAEILEIATVYRPTRKGRRAIPLEAVTFVPFSEARTKIMILERLRDHSSPRVVQSKIGPVLAWDDYVIRIKANNK